MNKQHILKDRGFQQGSVAEKEPLEVTNPCQQYGAREVLGQYWEERGCDKGCAEGGGHGEG